MPCLVATFSPRHRLPQPALRCSQAQPPLRFGRHVPRPQAADLSASAHLQEVGRHKAGWCHLELNLGSVVPPRPSSLHFLPHSRMPQACQTCTPPSLALGPCAQSSVPMPVPRLTSAAQHSSHSTLKHPTKHSGESWCMSPRPTLLVSPRPRPCAVLYTCPLEAHACCVWWRPLLHTAAYPCAPHATHRCNLSCALGATFQGLGLQTSVPAHTCRKLAGTRLGSTIWSSILALWCHPAPHASISSPTRTCRQAC